MTLETALHILTEVHTRADDVTGFVVEVGASPHSDYRFSQYEYLEAWRVVRASIKKQVYPPAPTMHSRQCRLCGRFRTVHCVSVRDLDPVVPDPVCRAALWKGESATAHGVTGRR